MPLLGLLSASLLPTRSLIQNSVRSASKKAGGSTRNRCKNTRGKRRGIKVYDGQRVEEGKKLVSQYRMQVMPGWNTQMLPNCNIFSLCHGRVFITTERMNPHEEAFEFPHPAKRIEVPELANQEKIFRAHVHVLPDTQHQYFKLTEQI